MVYNYDLAENCTSVIENGTTSTYMLGSGNRLLNVDGASSSVAFAYDTAGNTTNITSGTDALDLS